MRSPAQYVFVCALAVAAPAAAQGKPSTPAPAKSPRAPLAIKKWTGDLDGMIQRRLIRVLVAYNKTHYFVDRGTQRGITYDFMKKFEDELNTKLKTGHLRINVAFIPVSRDELLPALQDGRGDVAAANLTITPERQQLVDFTEPGITDVKEVVVTGPGAPAIATPDDLAGREVYVRQSSSFRESVQALNAALKQKGKQEVAIRFAPEPFEEEDILEMVNAGLVKITVTDGHLASFWKQIFTDLTVHEDVALREGGAIAPAIRKNSPKLKAELDAFIRANRRGSAFGNMTFQRYLRNVKYAKNATSDAEIKKFRGLIDFFRKYGDKYQMDWLLMAAQGYQESRLDHSVRSKVGAIGVMQVMPATGKELKVGSIEELEPNIHAGVKYIRFVIDEYFKDEPMDALNKGLFAFASYNAGPGRIRQLRREAASSGLDPNVWFNNVERVAAKRIGRETVTYVSNIFKYYVAYQLAVAEMEERRKAREAVPGRP